MRTLPPEGLRDQIVRVGGPGVSWVDYVAAVAEIIADAVPHDSFCTHTVDPGTILFTGSVNRNIACSGPWLAHHEYAVDDVNKWSLLAHTGRLAGATSIDTHGDLNRSARHRSHESFGLGDELRVSLVSDGVYWGAACFLRRAGEPWFGEADVQLVAALAPTIATGLRRALLVPTDTAALVADHGPGIVVFAADGQAESISPAAERWIAELNEFPAPQTPSDSKMVRAVAAQAAAIDAGADPLELAARARVRTRGGMWLVLYGTRLSGGAPGRVAVVIHPATPPDVAPVVAMSYGLTDRERDVTMQCIQGRDTRQIARVLYMSPYTVQDHLKSIFAKTGVRTRGELVGQVFLEHYAPRWERPATGPDGLWVKEIPTSTGAEPARTVGP